VKSSSFRNLILKIILIYQEKRRRTFKGGRGTKETNTSSRGGRKNSPGGSEVPLFPNKETYPSFYRAHFLYLCFVTGT